MVANVNDSMSAATKTHRWNLISLDAFPQWHIDLRREGREKTHQLFIGSTRPVEDPAELNKKRSVPGGQQKVSALLLQRQTLWDEWNVKWYNIIEASVELTRVQLEYVVSNFGEKAKPPFNGQEFYKWVISHASSTKTSSQLARPNAVGPGGVDDKSIISG